MLSLRHFSSRLIFLLFLLFPLFSYASDSFTVLSSGQDLKLHAGDEASFSIQVKNLMPRRYTSVYVFVTNANGGGSDKNSITSWLNIPRYIELKPGENRTIQAKFIVNREALDGIYTGQISFAEGMDEAGAERNLASGYGHSVNTSLQVYTDAVRRLQVDSFSTDRDAYFRPPVGISYQLENVGNTDLHLNGQVELYDQNGTRLYSLPAFDAGLLLPPGSKKDFSLNLGQSFGNGRFKVVLNLQYDNSSTTQMAYFTIISWQKVLLIFIASILLLLVMLNFSYTIYEKSL